jgi:beta-glucanase (GH16 family)
MLHSPTHEKALQIKNLLYKVQLGIFDTMYCHKTLLWLALCLSSSTSILAFDVTFQVDMSNETGFNTPEVNGTFNNWCGSCAAMTDTDGDGIWTITIGLNAGAYEYKYSYDNWSGQEVLAVGSPCTVTSGSFTNRTLNVSDDMVLPVVCFNTCAECVEPVPAVVDFYLNPGDNTFTDVSISGSFNSYCTTCDALTLQPNGLWKATLEIWPGNYQYYFRANGGTLLETLPIGNCTINTPGGAYRQITVVQDAAQAVVCWNSCSNCENGVDINDSWALIWAEEFNGNFLDTDTWNYDLGNNGWGNNEWQLYTSDAENIVVNGGSLKITAREEFSDQTYYTSSRIQSNNKFEFQYGKVEGRLKLPLGQGIWPAFWMLGGNIETVSWPNCGEIDIMEHVNNELMTHGTVHWENWGHQYEGSSVSLDPTEFHVYGVIWNEEKITFFVDGEVYFEFIYSQNPNSTNIFQNPFFFILNVAVGGNWPGYPDNTTVFPATMEVDYIRVFQQMSVGVEEREQEQEESFSMYPNPTNQALTIQILPMHLNENYVIWNNLGQQVQTGKISGLSSTIDVSSLSAGVYTISIGNSAGQRLMIQPKR